jgi:hypothetical protein
MTPLRYTHLYLIDRFYDAGDSSGQEKILVTCNEKTGEVLGCLKKIRLGDLAIFSPKRNADCRISVNLEIPGTAFLVYMEHHKATFAFQPLTQSGLYYIPVGRTECPTLMKNFKLTWPKSHKAEAPIAWNVFRIYL